jgi:hypothetical protein
LDVDFEADDHFYGAVVHRRTIPLCRSGPGPTYLDVGPGPDLPAWSIFRLS